MRGRYFGRPVGPEKLVCYPTAKQQLHPNHNNLQLPSSALNKGTALSVLCLPLTTVCVCVCVCVCVRVRV